MRYMEMLKNYFGNTKTSNLDQNQDMVEELGYSKPQPTPTPDPNDKQAQDSMASDTKTDKKQTDTATAATRG